VNRAASISVICLMGLAGSAWGQQAPAGNGAARPPERPTAAELLGQTGGSLLKASMLAGPDAKRAGIASVSFYAVPAPEPKTIKKHDLVTIIIREETQYTSDGTTDLKKQADVDAKLEQMVKFGGQWPWIQGGAIQPPIPEIKASGTRNFKGEATVDRMESLFSRITAEVIDVKPNGTFAVQARKRIKADEEEQEYLLTGVCRAADLTPDNTVLSTQVSDLSIERNTKGAVKDTTKRGWIPKLLDFVNPF
jgi:flagellar L-ring protein FlgH